MGRSKAKCSKNRKNKNTAQQQGQSSTKSSSLRSSISTAAEVKSYDGSMESPTPSSMSSYEANIEDHRELPSYEKIHIPRPPHTQRRWWMPRLFEWWPCRIYRWVRDFMAAFIRVLHTQFWLDQVYTLALLAVFLFGCWVAIEGLLQLFKPVAAQDVNCSVVYVTVPGPIMTISLMGATPSDPNKGTYYYSVINGTTHWLNSMAPHTRLSTFRTTTSIVATAPPPGPPLSFGLLPITPGFSTSSSLPLGVSTSPDLSFAFPPLSALPILGSTIVTTIVSRPTDFTTLSRSVPATISLPVPLPPTWSSITTVPSMPIPGLPGTPSMTGQLPPILPSHIVVTSTLSGPSSTLTVTLPILDGLSTPSGLVSSAPSSQIPSLASPSMPGASSIGIVLRPTTSSTARGPGAPILSSYTSVLPPVPTSSSPLQWPPAGSSASPLSTSSTALISITSVAHNGQTSIITRISTMSTGGSGGYTPSSVMSVLTDPSNPTLIGTSQNTESKQFTVSLPEPSLTYGVTSSGLGLSPLPTATSALISLSIVSPTGSSVLGSASTWPPPPPTSSGQPSPSASSIPTLSSGSSFFTPPSTSVPLTSTASTLPLSSGRPPTGFLFPTSSSLTSHTTNPILGPGAPPLATSTVLINTTSSVNSPSSTSLLNSSSEIISTTIPLTWDTLSSASSSAPGSTIPGGDPLTSSDRNVTASTSTCSGVLFQSNCLPDPNGFMTKVIAYGNVEFSLIFPKPNITTTVSFWTGTYPVANGPDWISLPLTTRLNRLTPLSTLSSLTHLRPIPSRFKTIITTVFAEPEELEGQSKKELVARQIPEISALPLPSKETGMSVLPISSNQPDMSVLPVPPISPAASSPPIASSFPAMSTISILPSQPTISAVPISSTKLATSTRSVPLSQPTLCGESGNFTLTFDDSTVGELDNGILPATGMRNPYHHLFYANGFAYLPDKWEPYPSVSQPNVAIFLPIGSSLLPNSAFAGTLLPGELGAGPRASVDAYWFNAHSGYFGCALNGLTPCTLRISGYRYDATFKQEVLIAEQNVTIPPCWGFINCKLTQIIFNENFQALSGIQFNAFTYGLGLPQMFMMDSLHMEWYNNTCSAGILRIGHS